MTGFFTELINIVIACTAIFLICLYPMRKTREAKTKALIIYFSCFALFLFGGLLAVNQIWRMDSTALLLYKIFITAFSVSLPLILYRKNLWSNLYLITASLAYAVVSVDNGVLFGEDWFSVYTNMTANEMSLFIVILTLPPLLFLLRRFYVKPLIINTLLWRKAWCLPCIYFLMFLTVRVSEMPGGFTEIKFIVSRILIYILLTVTSFILETSYRKINEAAERKAKENAEKNAAEMLAERTLFYHKFRFLLVDIGILIKKLNIVLNNPQEDNGLLKELVKTIMEIAGSIREELKGESEDFTHFIMEEIFNPLTAVSTCIQTVSRHPEEAEELLNTAITKSKDFGLFIISALYEDEKEKMTELFYSTIDNVQVENA